MTVVIVVGLYLVICSFAGAYLGKQRGRPIIGALTGLIGGPIGWIFIALCRPTLSELIRRELERRDIQTMAQYADPEYNAKHEVQ